MNQGIKTSLVYKLALVQVHYWLKKLNTFFKLTSDNDYTMADIPSCRINFTDIDSTAIVNYT